MSTAHTKGRLIVKGGYSIYADGGKTPVADTCMTNSMPENDEGNARRLVACWNACEGIPTEMLENVCKVPLAAVKLAKQNAELLKALKSAWLWMENQSDAQSKGGHATFDLMMLRYERDMARAAIDKTEGGAA